MFDKPTFAHAHLIVDRGGSVGKTGKWKSETSGGCEPASVF